MFVDLSVVRYVLFVVCSVSFVFASYVSFVFCCRLFVVCGLLFVGFARCLLFVVC